MHGGPMGASSRGFVDRIQLLAANGWLVFEPNYRGSVNRGNAYQSAIIGDAGEGPGRDVMAGLMALIGRGIVDTTRMALAGWSYGGYMTVWLMGHYQRWKAAVAGAAVTDFSDSYNLSDLNIGYGYGWGGSMWSERYELLVREQSPITSYLAMRTPTLILSNTGDVRVPIVESYKLYHALKDRGVPVKFVAYPIGGHVPGDPVHMRDVYRRMMEWLRRYLE
jgi:dipeptidyl aminopeptidase/acylaminoacyl peptidase